MMRVYLMISSVLVIIITIIIVTVKPVCNDHLSNKSYYLWFIQ